MALPVTATPASVLTRPQSPHFFQPKLSHYLLIYIHLFSYIVSAKIVAKALSMYRFQSEKPKQKEKKKSDILKATLLLSPVQFFPSS